jgi:hypothetical protein
MRPARERRTLTCGAACWRALTRALAQIDNQVRRLANLTSRQPSREF